MYMSTFAHMIQAGVELAGMAGNYANLLFMLTLIFCGWVLLIQISFLPHVLTPSLSILVTPTALPGFWIFLYRVSPYNYLVGAVLSVGLANAKVRCSGIELLHFEPPSGTTCSSYMNSFIEYSGGYLTNPDSTTTCAFCPLDATAVFLKTFGIEYANRWRNFAIMWVFVFVNICGAFFFYWLVRVPKKKHWVVDEKGELVSTAESQELLARQDDELAKVEKRRREKMVDEGVFVGGDRGGSSRGVSSRGAASKAGGDCEL